MMHTTNASAADRERFAGCMQIGGLRLAFYVNTPRYHAYLNELFPLMQDADSGHDIGIRLLCRTGETAPETVRTVYTAEISEVTESRKRLICTGGSAYCEIFAEVKNAEALYYTYVLPALKLTMAARGILTLHASAFETPSHTAAVCAAPGGSGKTSLSVLMLKYGAVMMTDDLIFVDPARQIMFAFPRPFHVDRSLAAHYGWLEQWLENSQPYMKGSKKYNLRFYELADVRHVFEMPLPEVLVFPVLGDCAQTELCEISERGAAAMLLSQLYFSPACCCAEAETLLNTALKRSCVLKLGRDMLAQPSETAADILRMIDAKKREADRSI